MNRVSTRVPLVSAVRHAEFDTPLGAMRAVAEGNAITGIYFIGQQHERAVDSDWLRDDRDPLLSSARVQLREYLAGARRRFTLPLSPHGTAFQLRVWQAIASIAFGTTATYADLARAAGSASAVRAAGAATGRNPISVVVPCHRVLGSDGSLTGYAGGIERKQQLLVIEGVKHA